MMSLSRVLRNRAEKFQKKKDTEYQQEKKLGAIPSIGSRRKNLNSKLIDKRLSSLLPPDPQPVQIESKKTALQVQDHYQIPTEMVRISARSRIFSLWFFLLMLASVLREDIMMVEAAGTAAEKIRAQRQRKKKSSTQSQVASDHAPSVKTIQQFSSLFTQASEVLSPPRSMKVDSFPSLMTTCSPITPEFVVSFCTGATSPENLRKVTTAIMDVIAIDPIIAEYVSIAFNFIPDFQIILTTREELKALVAKYQQDNVEIGGSYRTDKRALYLTCNPEAQDYDRSLIIHELRHVVMHAKQIAEAEKMVDSSDNYFPLIATEKEKAMSLMEKGNAKIRDLHHLLKREKNNALSLTEKKYLAYLRDLSEKNPHSKHYFQGSDFGGAPKKYFETSFKGKVGQVMNIEGHDQYGPLKMTGYTQVAPNSFTVHFVLADPLWTLVRSHEKALIRVFKYPQGDWAKEMDAHLFQRVQMPFFREFFSEYLEYTQQLIANTSFPDRLHFGGNHGFVYAHDFELQRFLSRPEDLFKPSDANKIVEIVTYFSRHHVRLDLCERSAQLLIKHGIKSGYVLLGDVNYLRENYVAASNSYELALQNKIIMRSDQLLQYAKALMENKNYKTAEELCNKALRNTFALGWTKEKFEEIKQSAIEKQNTLGLAR